MKHWNAAGCDGLAEKGRSFRRVCRPDDANPICTIESVWILDRSPALTLGGKDVDDKDNRRKQPGQRLPTQAQKMQIQYFEEKNGLEMHTARASTALTSQRGAGEGRLGPKRQGPGSRTFGAARIKEWGQSTTPLDPGTQRCREQGAGSQAAGRCCGAAVQRRTTHHLPARGATCWLRSQGRRE